MMDLPGLGPRKAMALHQELGIDSLEDLRRAVESQSLRAVPGFGSRSEENLGRALKQKAASGSRLTLDKALAIAESLIEEMRRVPSVERAEYAGSLRRMRETIGDIDLLVATTDTSSVMSAFIASKHADQVLAQGATKSSILTKSGIQIDLRAVAPDEFGSALQYFTGSKDHNVRVREIAVARGLKLSEYGVFRVGTDERIASIMEDDVYAALGLATPPPTMREDRGEVQLAASAELPKLIQVSDLRGDLHMHTTRSDGKASLEEMARTAIALGLGYIAVTDHGLNVNVRTLSLEDIRTQRAEIDELNKAFKGFRILHGVELNIGADGGLDYDNDVLRGFDVVVASVHSGLTGDRGHMTNRVLKTLEHPSVNILGHPTARRIGRRDPIDLDIEAVFEAAAANRVALEVNSNPQRLDLRDENIRLARKYGCYFAINSDSHSPEHLSRISLGVATAQRGWLGPHEVINCMTLQKLKRFCDRSRKFAI